LENLYFGRDQINTWVWFDTVVTHYGQRIAYKLMNQAWS
jgi:hypothetical protein